MPPKYFVPELVGPLTQLRYRYIDRRKPLPPFPEHIQIQTVSGCNANCVFCPNKKTDLEIPIGKRMPMELWKRIVDQIVASPAKRMSPYLMNESTLDPDLPERIAYFTQRKRPDQISKINTHGSLMTEKMARGLMEAGIDRVNFSIQGIDPVEYMNIMSLKFERVVTNVERMIQLKNQHGYKTRICVVMLVTKVIEPQLPEIKEFWGKRGVTIHLNRLENRGKHTHIEADNIAVRKLKNFSWCNRMFNQVYILYDGRMVQCCADWEQKGVMGDASKDNIVDIWKNAKYREYRERFLTGKVEGMICDGCTKDGERGDDED